ncbi:circularly permuted type 2 ATP-grasp protein [Planctomycetaceae bacterium SH139]
MNNDAMKPADAEHLFSGYVPGSDAFDEVFTARDSIRPSWQEPFNVFADLGQHELQRRWSQVQEEIHATGIAYSVFDESAVVARPWDLDLLPQIVAADEWQRLAAGICQRAQLLNRILADLYGPQQLLSEGLLPADWLYSHPGFRRVYHGQQPFGGNFLHFYAADLARAPDGRWWVVSDRTDAPLGLGFALENRILTSRMFPNAISQLHIERLAPFFMTLQATLRKLAPTQRDNPRVVLLSQGPSGPNYFEDAYLARYLGYTLVEGGDLAVRDDQVFLKTLAGLLPVDVILRRLSDEFCDPLELRSEAGMGVPGLLQAARLGKVAVVNTLGSSLVESPSLMPFLPSIAKQWLGAELLLPSVATWWCGQASARQEVSAMIAQNQLGTRVPRAAYRVGRREAIANEELRNISSAKLSEMLQQQPESLVLQDTIQRSTSPVWFAGMSERWHVARRVYAVAVKGGYEVMPGGLVRLSQSAAALDETVLGGNVSQDTWVRSHKPVQQISLLPTANSPLVLRRSGAELPSRVADNLFWFGRNLERAQGTCRLLRLIAGRLTGDREIEVVPELDCLVRCLAEQGQVEPGFAVEGMRDRLPAIATVLPQSALDEQQTGSLRASVASAHRNASLVRDRLSLDIWRIVHQLERKLEHAAAATGVRPASVPDSSKTNSSKTNGPTANASQASPQQAAIRPLKPGGVLPFGLIELDELLDDSIISMAALDGLIAESMTRSPAWRFLDLGRRIERALFVVSLVRSLPTEMRAEENRSLEAMLEVADSIMTYRGRYLAAIDRAAALDLLVTDETNPRSLVYQFQAIVDHVANLPRADSLPLGTAEERIASSLLHGVRMIEVDDLTELGGERSKLGRLLLRMTDQLPKLSDMVSHRYLIHAGRPQQMSKGR